MAAENEQKDYGKRIEYDPLWKGPLQEKRTRTDSNFLIAFVVFVFIWIAVSVYALTVGNANTLFEEIKEDPNYPISAKNMLLAAKIGVGFSILSGVASIIFIILLRWYAKIMVYTAIVVICIGLLGAIIVLSILSSSPHFQASGIALIVVVSIMLLIMIGCAIYFHKKINIACEIVREASKAVMFFPSSLVFPILPNLFHIIVSIYCLIVTINLGTLGYFTNNGTFVAPTHVYFLLIINFFGLFWLCGFISGFAEMTLSGSFSTWYWTIHKAYVPNNTILHCMSTTARYHLGTIAFGSLIIAICQLINALLSYVRSKIQQQGNSFTCFCFTWYSYLFQNLEQFVKFMSRGAYVMSSMHGTGFIQSTKDAFNLYMRNILKVIVTSGVTDGILALGAFIAMGLSFLATWGFCSSQNLDHIMPVAFSAVIFFSALISIGFFMVLKSAVDTIFLCVLEDYERNDGSEERPYYMSLKIQSLLFKEQSESV